MMRKNISLRPEAYDRLRDARRHPRESFSDVIMRAQWSTEPVTARAYLALVRARGPLFDDAGLTFIEEADRRA